MGTDRVPRANYDYHVDPSIAKTSNPYPWDYHAGANGGNQSHVVMESCLVYDNESGISGGHSPGTTIVRNSTITGNDVGLTSVHPDDPGMEKVTVTNSIVRGNGIDNVNDLGPATHRFNYSDYDPSSIGNGSPGGYGGGVILAGANNINADPMFVDPNSSVINAYHLYGDSPCVDTGTDLGQPWYDPNKAGTAPDMGVFEHIPGDTDADGDVDIDDYINLILNYDQAGDMDVGDFDGDGTTDIDDYIDLILNYNYSLGAAAAASAGQSVALGVSISVSGNTASASITADTYGNTSYTYVWTASSATNSVYAYGGSTATFDIDEPGQYVVTVTVFGNVGGKATAVYRYLVVE